MGEGALGQYLRAMRVQGRVIHALIIREFKTRFGRERLGYAWALLEPMMYVAAFSVLMSIRRRGAPPGIPVLLFMLSGFVPFFGFRNTSQRCLGIVASNRAMLSFPQVTIFDMFMSRLVLEGATSLVTFFTLALCMAVGGLPVSIENPLAVVGWIMMMSLHGIGMGMIFGSLVPIFPSIQHFLPGFVIRPLFFTSGLFFTAGMLPPAIREIALYNPLMHCLELLRSGFFVQFESPYADPSYPMKWAVGLLFTGLLMQRALRRRMLIAAQLHN